MLDKNKEPFLLFDEWFNLAKQKELNDPNAMNLATISEDNKPHSRMVLLKDHSADGFTFYTNTESNKGIQISQNNNVALCFHWKSLQRQIRIEGSVKKVDDSIADSYFNSRGYMSRIGALSSKQSSVLNPRSELEALIEDFKKKYPDENNVPRPQHWSGWRLLPNEIEFWVDGEGRIHERLNYKNINGKWDKEILYP